MKLVAALAFTIYLVVCPGKSLIAAREAMRLWAQSVAPALFPFMALMPLISGEEARAVYRKIAARPMKKLFRLPPEATAAVMVGWLAGSPAGAMAVARTAHKCSLTPAQAFTAGILGAGCGPVFLVCSVGAGMFADAVTGGKFFLCGWMAHLICGMIAARRKQRSGEAMAQDRFACAEPSAVRDAAMGVITVCGWMVLFSVLASALPGLVRPFLEVSSGCAYAAKGGNALLAAFLCGFGGVCAGCQNIDALKNVGVRPISFFGYKLLAGLLSAGLYAACDGVAFPAWRGDTDALLIATFIALTAALMIVMGILLKREKHSV